MRSLAAVRSATALSGLALLGGLALMLGSRPVGAPALGLLAVGSLAGLLAIAASAVRERSARPARAAAAEGRLRPSRSGAAAAGAAMIGGLLLALASGDAARAGVEITLAGPVAGAVLVTPAVSSKLRRVVWPALAIGLAVLAIWLLARLEAVPLPPTYLWELALLFGVVAGGVLLLTDALGASQRRHGPERSGWSLITRSGRGPSAPVRRSATMGRAVVGGLMVLWATGFGIAVTASHVEGNPVLIVLSALAIVIAAVVVIGTPLLVTALVSRQRRSAERTRETERQRIAAHLHDSVLQTLALVQRQATDADAVTRLAHRQEISLRNWMAGESELEPGSLAAALRAIVFEVEDATEASIELSMVGDRPTEPRDEALVAATREALRNAARHARGSPVAVYAEVMDRQVEVYVSDDGPGFVPAEVPETRRGIRDAIFARMEAAGGSAEILAEPGHGTEVMLRLPAA
jgi:signal transduction histidine kinase